MPGNGLGRKIGPLEITAVYGSEGPVFEMFEQGQALGIAKGAQVWITPALNPPLRIPRRLPMPRNVDINQWVIAPFPSRFNKSRLDFRAPQSLILII